MFDERFAFQELELPTLGATITIMIIKIEWRVGKCDATAIKNKNNDGHNIISFCNSYYHTDFLLFSSGSLTVSTYKDQFKTSI